MTICLLFLFHFCLPKLLDKDLPGALSMLSAIGVKHFIVEQEMVNEPEKALKRSFNYLASL